MHPDAKTIAGHYLEFYAQEPYLDDGKLAFRPSPSLSRDESVLRATANAFSRDGGLKVLDVDDGKLAFRPSPSLSRDKSVLRATANAFSRDGGLKVLDGNLGRAVIKVSAVAPENRRVRAPARIFHTQEEVEAAYRAGELNSDFVAVVRFQGPKAIGMPELHKN